MTEGNTHDNYMLVLEDRIFYLGLLGHRMKTRRLGGLAIYLAPSGQVRLKEDDGVWTTHDLAIVPPYQSHQVASGCGRIISVLIEPEKLKVGEIRSLFAQGRDPAQRAALAARLREAGSHLSAAAPDGDMTASEFDRIVLGRELQTRAIDARIKATLEELTIDGGEYQPMAADLARNIGLSSSRFLHLFKEQTGVSFRNYRMWRRARTFLLHANLSNS
ncbi:helix-turn-helix domain-containing protein, partial [Cribrihabitans sp. XS_ASV171]